MKVLWLAPHPIPDNKKMHPAPWITTLATHLVEQGVKITVVTTTSVGEAAVTQYKLEHYNLYSVKVPKLKESLFSLLKNRIQTLTNFIETILPEYDLIHVHGTEYQLASSVSELKQLNKPVVISIQGIIYKYKQYLPSKLNFNYLLWSLYAWFEKKEIRHFDNFTGRTHWDEDAVKSLNPDAQFSRIWEMLRDDYNNIDIYTPGNNILFSGGANPLKGLDFCLQVFDKLLETNNMQLHVIGNCDQAFITTVCKNKKLKNIREDNIKLWGVVDASKMVNIYQDCFCLYHPSLIDNSPNSVCEAQLWGLPVLANNTGGLSSLIEDNKTGILLTPGNKQEHVKKLQELKHSTKLQHLLSANARTIAIERHNPDKITEQTITVYKKLIAGGK